MTNQRKTFLMIFAIALIALCLPIIAAAQGSSDPWGRNRDDRRDNRDDRRDRRDSRRNDDDYYRNNRYDERAVRDVANRLKNRSKDFQRHLDSALDHSRYDDSRREDRINEVAKEFRDAANDLKDRIGNGRDPNRSSNEARRVLQLGAQINNFMSRNQVDSRTQSDWAQIRQDLRVIADIYGNNNYDYNDGNYRRNDDYRRRDNDRNRDNNRRRVQDIFRRIP